MLHLGSMSLPKSLLDLTVFVGIYFTNELMVGINSSKKLSSVISSLSVINLQLYLQIDKARKKKKLPASFGWYFPREVCHITDRNIICNFISVFIYPSVYPSVNTTYH